MNRAGDLPPLEKVQLKLHNGGLLPKSSQPP